MERDDLLAMLRKHALQTLKNLDHADADPRTIAQQQISVGRLVIAEMDEALRVDGLGEFVDEARGALEQA